jgi:molecular chaperone DnaK (HSP70)
VRGWAIDLGTSNTGIVHWDDETDAPRWLAVQGLCRDADSDNSLVAPRLIPSATEVLPARGLIERVGRNRVLGRHFFFGQWAVIGKPALDRNQGHARPSFARGFKTLLGRAPLHTLARVGARPISAREVARCFVRELLAATKRQTGERVRELVVTTPVEAYESYRMEVVRLFAQLGCTRVRCLDEPVAAALGYGIGFEQRRLILVMDFGGGTLNLALVRLDPNRADQGSAQILAKAGAPLGGNDVDGWLADELCRRFGYDLAAEADDTWRNLLVDEARRVKEEIYFKGQGTFFATLPEELRQFEARLGGPVNSCEISRAELTELITRRGLYRAIEDCLASVEKQSSAAEHPLESVDDVLMVGGSTLLPGVYCIFQERFGRERVRAFQPFEAVAYGASAFSAGRLTQSDFVVHDYAFLTHDVKSHEPSYTTIVPAGTRFPTPPDFWKRKLVPTCSQGTPETLFKLVVCEIGTSSGKPGRFGWDAGGNVYALGGSAADSAGSKYVVKLNEANPTLGFLDPPHQPQDRTPRLEIAFGVNSERWLVASVRDLKTGKALLSEESVVRLV